MTRGVAQMRLSLRPRGGRSRERAVQRERARRALPRHYRPRRVVTATDADGKPLVSRARARKLLLFFAKRLINSTSKKPKRGQKAKTLEADFKPHKAVVLANARFPRKRRGTCTRASPTARLGIGRRAHLLLSLPARARFVRRRGSRTGALVPASPGFAKSDGWRIPSADRGITRASRHLARDVLLSVHPRQARPSGNDLDRRAPGQKAEETADHGDGRRHRRSCVPHIFFSSPLAHPVGDARLVPGTPS